ncbi:MAG: hypothetical protein EHM88_19920, partial [Candidatus Rokuibacteriota bacterium]
MATATERVLGKSIKRREDPRFITGKGTYVDDVKVPGTTYAVFVRSPHAHAKITKIDTAAAREHPGVVAVFTGADMTGVNSLPCGWLLPELKVPPHMPLGLRFSATDYFEGGWNLEQTLAYAHELKKRGCSFFDVSGGGMTPEQKVPLGPGYQVPFAEAVKRETQVPTMAVGLITEADQAEE